MLLTLSLADSFSSYFICFAYPPPFLRLAEISRQFTLCALHRFPPSRFRLPWHTYPNCLFRRLTLAVFLWNSTVSDTYTCTRIACTCTTVRRRVGFYRRGGSECSLLHLFPANSPLKTAYASYHRLPSRLAFFLTCREAVLVKRLRVNSVKRGCKFIDW